MKKLIYRWTRILLYQYLRLYLQYRWKVKEGSRFIGHFPAYINSAKNSQTVTVEIMGFIGDWINCWNRYGFTVETCFWGVDVPEEHFFTGRYSTASYELHQFIKLLKAQPYLKMMYNGYKVDQDILDTYTPREYMGEVYDIINNHNA